MSINERPEFAAAMRGYDRQQVDDYVQVVLQYVEELELRASEAAEAAGRVRAPHSAPPGAGQAEPARARVHAPSVAEAVRAEADRVVAAAWAEAQQIVQAAKSEAALITATSLGLPPAGRLEITAPQHCVREGFLSYRDDSGQAQVVALRPPSRWAIGRAQGSDVPLGWDSRVSRWHAQIERVGNEWWLIDDGMSTNGTFVNEARLDGRRRLSDGDVVRAGQTELTFSCRHRLDISEGAVQAQTAPLTTAEDGTRRPVR